MDGFVCTLIENIRAALGPDVEISRRMQEKNNCVNTPYLTIRNSDRCFAPSIRLDTLFMSYKSGFMNIESITDQITSVCTRQTGGPPDISRLFEDPRMLSERIYFRLVNYERNREILKTRPHIRFLDLAVTFCIHVPFPEQEIGSIQIDNKIAGSLGFTVEKLGALALKNTPVLFPKTFSPIEDIIDSIMKARGGCGLPDLPPGSGPSMNVLSNRQCCYGAACILYPGVLEEIRKKLGRDFYVIPSSVNEVIILTLDEPDPSRLREMVREVNRTVVAPEEILSDNIFRYPEDLGPDRIAGIFGHKEDPSG